MGWPDGSRVKDLQRYRRMMPFFMKRKSESIVYWNVSVRARGMIDFCHKLTDEYGMKVTPFMLVLHSLYKTFTVYPRANRFAKVGHIYQRNSIWFAFSVKKQWTNKATVSLVKKEFKKGFTLKDTVEAAKDKIAEGRDLNRMDEGEKEAKSFLWIPSFIIRLGYPFYKMLEEHGFVSRKTVLKSPMYSSAFFANVGAFELSSGYHHLYEIGNTSVFMVVGRMEDRPVVEDGKVVICPILPIKGSIDERMEDGFYLGKALKYFADQLEHPEKLLEPPGPPED